jgi:hypothetical protein
MEYGAEPRLQRVVRNTKIKKIFDRNFLMPKKLHLLLFILLCTLIISACGPAKDPAAGAVESYINALVKKDVNRMSALSCAEWEPQARMEFDSFQAITTRLEGLSCTVSGTDKDSTAVSCKGKIIATYNNEDQDFDLSLRVYKVVNQGGEFLVCGYQ